MKDHVDITLHGKVQGVGLRYETKEYADSLGIHGYVRNMRDGTVVIEAEGDKQTLDKFINWCKSSSSLSSVKEVEIKKGKVQNYRYFQSY